MCRISYRWLMLMIFAFDKCPWNPALSMSFQPRNQSSRRPTQAILFIVIGMSRHSFVCTNGLYMGTSTFFLHIGWRMRRAIGARFHVGKRDTRMEHSTVADRYSSPVEVKERGQERWQCRWDGMVSREKEDCDWMRLGITSTMRIWRSPIDRTHSN